MITQRSTYPAENWTSNTKKPHQVILQSYFRYEPISPSYDPNEFVKNYNKKSHQKFRQLRPAKKRPYRWIFEFFLRDWLELDGIFFFPFLFFFFGLLPATATKNQKIEENLRKKARLKHSKIRKNRIKLLLFTFENKRKIKEKSALFGGPYRNSHRQFFYSPYRTNQLPVG